MIWRHAGRWTCALALLATPLMATLSAAADGEGDDTGPLRFGVFGTLGALYHDDEGVEYRRTRRQPHGVEADEIALGNDSLLGAQVNLRANDHVEGVLQAVSQWRADNSWRPEVTWAFLRLTTDESVVLRLGRVAPETQLNSDSRLIGYGALAIRQGQDLQATVTPDYMDGGDLKYNYVLGDGVATAKLFYGTTAATINVQGSAVEQGDTLLRGLILGYDADTWSGRLYGGVATLRSVGPLKPLVDQLRAIPAPQYLATADTLDNLGAKVRFIGADLGYEGGPYRLQASILRQTTHPAKLLVPDGVATALIAGYRLGVYTPYVQYGRARQRGTGYAGGLGEPLDTIIRQAVDGAQLDQWTRGLGVRIDFAQNAALKLQVDHISARHSGLLTQTSTPAGTRRSLTLFGAALDFAF